LTRLPTDCDNPGALTGPQRPGGEAAWGRLFFFSSRPLGGRRGLSPGHRTPLLGAAARLAQALGVSLDVLEGIRNRLLAIAADATTAAEALDRARVD
jgi:hypothetical protein